jgi:hypothetical protein
VTQEIQFGVSHCPRSLLDGSGRQFRFDPARHALSPQERAKERRFRFCFEVPSGFHCDVEHQSGGEFSLKDHLGALFQKIRHANVDPWGSVRT